MRSNVANIVGLVMRAALAIAAGVASSSCGQPHAKVLDLGGACPNLPLACPTTPPSWASEVSGLVASHCAGCHSPGGSAPSRLLTTYDEVFAQRSAVLDQVYGCTMPPATDPVDQLDADDKATLLDWLSCRAPNN